MLFLNFKKLNKKLLYFRLTANKRAVYQQKQTKVSPCLPNTRVSTSSNDLLSLLMIYFFNNKNMKAILVVLILFRL